MKKKGILCAQMLIVVLLSLLFVKYLIKFVYLPFHPKVVSMYQQRHDYVENIGGNNPELLNPPVGGCYSSCQGTQSLISCENYSRKYDKCTFNCYGYVDNNCSSSILKVVIGLFVK